MSYQVKRPVFDYVAQVWTRDGIVLDCGHPSFMTTPERFCCEARRFAGMSVTDARAALRNDAIAEGRVASFDRQVALHKSSPGAVR